MVNKIKIMIVDDHEIFRKGIQLTVKLLGYAQMVGEATNGREFLNILPKINPDIVLMDIKMPKMDGIEACKEALKIKPKLKIVALSMFGDEKYLHSMLEAGAKGFILKSINKEGLDYALQVISQEKNYFSAELLPYLSNQYTDKSQNIQFSSKEKQLLELMTDGENSSDIASILNISERSLSNIRSSLYKKTNTKSIAQLVAFSIKNNLITNN